MAAKRKKNAKANPLNWMMSSDMYDVGTQLVTSLSETGPAELHVLINLEPIHVLNQPIRDVILPANLDD